MEEEEREIGNDIIKVLSVLQKGIALVTPPGFSIIVQLRMAQQN